MAYAGAEFADSVMAALSGDKGEPARPLATFSLFFSVWEGENVPRRGGRGGGALAILAYAPVQCTKLSRRGCVWGGEAGVTECTFVESKITDAPFFSSPVSVLTYLVTGLFVGLPPLFPPTVHFGIPVKPLPSLSAPPFPLLCQITSGFPDAACSLVSCLPRPRRRRRPQVTLGKNGVETIHGYGACLAAPAAPQRFGTGVVPFQRCCGFGFEERRGRKPDGSGGGGGGGGLPQAPSTRRRRS